MYGDLGISKEVLEYGARIEAALEDRFTEIDGNAEYNQLKVIAAMQKNRVSDIHFSGCTGKMNIADAVFLHRSDYL